ncbi:hypothetical protein LJB89_02000 [Tyzzerella sp. OttesenSCG-928-J15]|nr:hypothetical protein [Tyzzerella sp. OttesenSCG-928-J15]
METILNPVYYNKINQLLLLDLNCQIAAKGWNIYLLNNCAKWEEVKHHEGGHKVMVKKSGGI